MGVSIRLVSLSNDVVYLTSQSCARTRKVELLEAARALHLHSSFRTFTDGRGFAVAS